MVSLLGLPTELCALVLPLHGHGHTPGPSRLGCGGTGEGDGLGSPFHPHPRDPTPPPLFLHRERGAVAVGSVEPPEDLSSRSSSNRSCRALRFEGFGSMDPDLVRPVQEPGGPCTSQGLSGLDPASFPLAGAPSFRRAYLFEYGLKSSKR
eukprot:scaffold287_cov337-Pavlova_lutheri.AAC.34